MGFKVGIYEIDITDVILRKYSCQEEYVLLICSLERSGEESDHNVKMA